MNKKIIFIILFLILCLGSFLRLYNLNNSPPSLNWDEAAWGYNAFSVSQTLRDEYGKFLPIFTRSFDEYKSTLPMYLMIPSIRLFGLNELGVRFPSALIGVFTILVIYYLSIELFKNERVALFSAFVFSIEPWSVHLSRVYYDANEAMFFLLLGILLFVKSLKSNKLMIFSVLSFVISMFTYNADKILSPLILLFLVFVYKKELKNVNRKYLFISVCIFISFLMLFVALVVKGEALARVSTTNIFVLWKDEQSPRLYYFVWDLVGRYISYFSPYNLFLREPQEPSTIVAGNSIFYAYEFIPWLYGMYLIFKDKYKSSIVYLIMFLAPIPAMLTWNWFQPGRVMSLFAVYSIFIGLGLWRVSEFFHGFFKKIFVVGIVLYGLLNAFYLFDSINVYLPFRDNGNYQPGFRETVPEVMKIENKYDQIVIETPQSQPYIFYLFYGQYSPTRYAKELDLNYIGTPRKHFDFGKFHFRKINWEEDKKLKNTLFVKDNFDNIKDVKIIDKVKDRYGGVVSELATAN